MIPVAVTEAAPEATRLCSPLMAGAPVAPGIAVRAVRLVAVLHHGSLATPPHPPPGEGGMEEVRAAATASLQHQAPGAWAHAPARLLVGKCLVRRGHEQRVEGADEGLHRRVRGEPGAVPRCPRGPVRQQREARPDEAAGALCSAGATPHAMAGDRRVVDRPGGPGPRGARSPRPCAGTPHPAEPPRRSKRRLAREGAGPGTHWRPPQPGAVPRCSGRPVAAAAVSETPADRRAGRRPPEATACGWPRTGRTGRRRPHRPPPPARPPPAHQRGYRLEGSMCSPPGRS